ncbi:MAG: fibronectin type III domain-containing protein [Candidatus Sumerlaeaceae bacterium]
MSTLNRAIVHHTAGNEFNTTGYEASKANVRAIQSLHKNTNGWSDIGYHFLVDKFGYIFEGRYNSMGSLPRGAHDGFNTNSFGFNVMGYFHPTVNNVPTAAMMNSLYDIIAWRMPSAWRPYGSPGGTYGDLGNTVGYVDSHRRVKATACPGDNVHNPYIGNNVNAGTIRAEINNRIIGGTPWDATFNNQSYVGAMYPGQAATFWVEYKNVGTNTWTPGGGNPTRLGTSSPRDRSSAFFTSGNWPNASRPTDVDASTGPNGIGRFSFVATAPQTPGYYVENWELVTEGVSWFEGAGDGSWFGIEVAKQGDNIQWECEDYSRGIHAANNVDYFDTTAGNTGGAYRSQDVDIRACVEGGYQVGWTEPGESLRYYFYGGGNSYRFAVRYSNGSAANASVRLRVDGVDVGTVILPPTANYDTMATAYTHVSIGSAALHELKIDVMSGNPDLNNFRLDKVWNPPHNFSFNAQGYDVWGRNGLSAISWTDCCGWPGIMYTDQTGNDAFVYSGATNFTGGSYDLIHVRVFPQGGTSASHNMQIFWLNSEDWAWNSAKSSDIVYFTAQDAWADVYLYVGPNSGWNGKTITQLRLDFDNTSVGTRWHVDSLSIEQQPTAPAAPTGLAATAASSSQINLAWTDASNNEENFVVARSATAGGPYTDLATLGANVTSYSDTGLSPLTAYYYVVRATNAAGSSANSSEASATTLSNIPTAPSGLAAAATTPYDINLTWTDNSANEANFVVGRSSVAGGPYVDIVTLGANVTSYTNSGLSPSTTYYYVVRATNSGGSSANSNEASATTLQQPPNAPSALGATAISSTQINLAWTDNSTNEANFVVARGSASGGPYTDIATLGANVTSYSNTGLTAATTYYYVVRATNAGGASANSNQASATTLPNPPAAPSGLVATAASNGTQVDLGWADNSGNEANFIVARSATSGGPYSDIATLAANTTSYSNTGLAENTTYYYVVRATNSGGSSGNSNQATATTPVPDRIIDNPSASLTGTFSTGTSALDKFGADYNYRSQGTGANYATFTPTLAVAGRYSVYEWHPQGTNRTIGAPHVITFDGASDTIAVNQQVGGGAWNLLGTFNFAAGSSGNVRITDAFPDAGQLVLVDAIKFVYVGGAVAPAAPTGLAATAASPSQINLSWNNVLNESGYVVARSTTSGGPYTDIATLGANVTSYSNTGLAQNTSYYYVVRATNSAGASANSAQAAATTPVAPPAAPSGLSATALTQTKVSLSWTDNATNEANYVVSRATTAGGPYTDIATLAANSVSYTDTGLSASTAYYYVVRATNAGGGSGNSNEAAVTTPVPATITVDAVGADDGWALESAAGSNVGGSNNGINTTFAVGDMTGNRAYRGIVSFDTSGLPDDASVTKATLRLTQYSLNGTDPWAVLGTQAVDIKTPNFGAVAGMENSDWEAGAGAASVGTVPKPAANGSSVDAILSSGANGHVSVTAKTQMKLRFTTNTNSDALNNYVNWYSGDFTTDTTKRPKLIIEYVQ